MKNSLFLILLLKLCSSCNTSTELCRIKKSEARRLDSTLFTQMELDTTLGKQAVYAFLDFASQCASDSTSSVFFIKTAQVSRALKMDSVTERSLNAFIDRYPKSANKPLALFLKAQLYDEDGPYHSETKAASVYNEIIQQFPHSEWALSAKGALEFIGKTDLEISNELLLKTK
jgi:outer membrane protein assembly factor BamD (BamD/ComL family)